MTPHDRIDQVLNKYRNKRIAVQYSAGLDSSLLAHFLAEKYNCQVALVMCDCSYGNSPKDEYFDASKPVDNVRDMAQFELYGKLLKSYHPEGRIEFLPVRLPPLNAHIVKPENLLPDPDAAEVEANNVVFFAGFNAMRFSGSLSVAAANGYDHVVTGHLGFNSHYRDESLEAAELISRLFSHYYSNRLVTTPDLQMPWRLAKIETKDLLLFNETLTQPLRYADTISCNVSVLRNDADDSVADFLYVNGRQVHCGKCPHCLNRRESFANAGLIDNANW